MSCRRLSRTKTCLASVALAGSAALAAHGETPVTSATTETSDAAANIGSASWLEDWTPSLALGVLVHGQDASADGTTSYPVCSPTTSPGSSTPGCFTDGRPPATGSPSLTSGIPDLRVALYGPSLGFVSERIRPFVHGGWQYGWLAFESEVTAAQEGNLGQIIFPAGTNGPSNVAGVGTISKVDIKNGWFAGLGLAFEIPWQEYDLRLLPSVDYYGQRVSLSGTSRRVAELIDPISGAFDKAEFRIEELSGKNSKVLHALGPRLALEADIARSGSLVVSGFVEVGAFIFLNDRELRVRGTGGGTGDFSFESDPVTVHGGGGIRFYWQPERRGL